MSVRRTTTGREPHAGGRRPGESGTRESILREARRSFAESGYRGATVRSIAGAAQVDPALVYHFYGSKADLFAAAMELPLSPVRIIEGALDGDLAGLGRRIVAAFVRTWDDPAHQAPLLGMLRATLSNDASVGLVRDYISTQILTRLASRLSGADREWRTSLVGTQLLGLGMARYLMRLEPLASATPEEVVEAVAPSVQRYLTGDLGTLLG